MPKIFIAIMVLLYTNNTFAQCEVEISPDTAHGNRLPLG